MTEDQLREYANYLIDCHYKLEIVDEKIKLYINIEGIDLVLWCCLGKFFPYEIPKVYIDESSYEAIPSLPHIHTDKSICVFDESKVIPNFNEPEKLLITTIDTAVSIIREGILGNNQCDFIDEFLEYWTVKAILKAKTFIENLDCEKSFCWFFKKEGIIAAENEQRLKEISYAIDGKVNKKYYRGILIPINGKFINKIPKNDLDIVKIIKKNSSFKEQYNSFVQKNKEKPCLVILNIMSPEGNMLVGWMHQVAKMPNGFRKNKVDLNVLFSMKENKGIAVTVENCHQNRLFTRGGDGKKDTWKSVALIGCGSVGSFFAEALRIYGTERFILNDNQILQYENIARHVCGYFFVGMSKVSALKFRLQKDNPNIICDTYIENAHEFLENEIENINLCEVIIVAVGSVTVEHHINRLMLTDKIIKPIVLVWVEPYMIGGHAIIIKKKQNLFGEIFDENTFEFKNSIVQNGSEYLKREAGCQSTYMPYSGFMLQQFIYNIIDHLISDCWNRKGNYLLTWCGKLSDAIKYDMKLSKEYEEIDDYSLIKRRID